VHLTIISLPHHSSIRDTYSAVYAVSEASVSDSSGMAEVHSEMSSAEIKVVPRKDLLFFVTCD
jgi:hypothetical protein